MRVLVTGGAGYVGSHACKAFARAGHDVTVFDNLSRGFRSAVRWGGLIEADLLDQDALDAAVAAVRPDVVVHFAALAYVGESNLDPAIYYRTNITGTQNLLDAMRRHDVEKIVFSSTCATYGHPVKLPIDECHPQNPINPYGRSKLFVEAMIADYCAAYGMSAIALRYFNAAGCDPEGEIGEAHDPETHVIPLALEAALAGTGFTINGTDFDTPDGTAIRDYIHVTDLAEAHLLAAGYLAEHTGFTPVNLGTGRGTSVRELVAAVATAAGRSLHVIEAARRQGDPAILVASADRARAVLGWKPEHSDLATILSTALAWQQRTGPVWRAAHA